MLPEVSTVAQPLDTAALVAQMRPALVRFFRRRCGKLSEAEDLAQETILRGLGAASWSSTEQAKGYIFRTAINLWRDRQRRLRVQDDAEVAWEDRNTLEVSEEIAPERVLLSEEELRRVQAALLELNERTRDVFMLHRLEKLKYAAIAKTLGISVSAVEKHMSKALAHLTRRIDDHDAH
jgi:RNA polymerase sigma-70 factor (ECF subfamily)